MEFSSINPHTGETFATYSALSSDAILHRIELAEAAFEAWRKRPLVERTTHLQKAGQILRLRTAEFAEMITREMGKPISEARSEVQKCAWVCDYYAEHAADFLAPEHIATDAQQSFVRHDPIGVVLAVMPWNFPFWQVFRFAAPTLTAGNTALLKHASNVMGCAQLIESVFRDAGYPEAVFQNLAVHHDATAQILAHDAVKAVSLTGSERAGTAVARLAGENLKKSLLELGGNNAFIVWEDADLEATLATAVTARMLNTGQSCIAAKRFILVGDMYDRFVPRFVEKVAALRAGDPLAEETQVGPLARKDLADTLQSQVQASLAQGAQLLLGGTQEAAFHAPTVLGEVTPGMPAFEEETFGPLAAMVRARDIDHAFSLANQSRYGLGMTVCTTDLDKAIAMADRVQDGAYFINELVKSDPRLPFGGTKISGYGRELARDGMLEFVNRKTVYVK